MASLAPANKSQNLQDLLLFHAEYKLWDIACRNYVVFAINVSQPYERLVNFLRCCPTSCEISYKKKLTKTKYFTVDKNNFVLLINLVLKWRPLAFSRKVFYYFFAFISHFGSSVVTLITFRLKGLYILLFYELTIHLCLVLLRDGFN